MNVGVIGFVKKGSKASLVAGLLCGGIYGFSGYLIHSNNEQGHDIAAITSVLLAAIMGARVIKLVSHSLSYFLFISHSYLSFLIFNRTGKFMPAGLVTVCATLVGSYSAYKSYSFRDL